MPKKAPTVNPEPLLNTVARKLGYAAGTVTKVTHEFTENISSFPDAVTAKVREAANLAMPAGNSPRRTRLKKARLRKKARPAPPARKAKSTALASKRRVARKPLSRSPRKPPQSVKRSQ